MAEIQWSMTKSWSDQEQTKMCLAAEYELNLISSLSANAWKLLKRRRPRNDRNFVMHDLKLIGIGETHNELFHKI